MKLQVSPNNWTCMATATAMALDKPLYEVIEGLGHSGSESVWPPEWNHLPAGYHIHEIIDYVWMQHAKPVTPFVRRPMVTPAYDCPDQVAKFAREPDLEKRFKHRIAGRVGIMTGVISKGRGHAVAWDGRNIYDPRGYVYSLDTARQFYNYYVDTFWMFGGLDVSAFTVVS